MQENIKVTEINIIQKLEEYVTCICQNESWAESTPVKNALDFIKEHNKSKMKTILPAAITTVEEAKAFLTELHKNGEAFHPEDDARHLSGNLFTEEEGGKLNKLMDNIYNLPGNDGRHDKLAFCPCEYLQFYEWTCTDQDTEQYFRMIKENEIYEFKEDRWDPETEKMETYTSEMNINDYTEKEKKEALHSFGYSNKEIAENKWMQDVPFILECLFEFES